VNHHYNSSDFCTFDCGRTYPLISGLRLTGLGAPGADVSTCCRLLYGGLTRASIIILLLFTPFKSCYQHYIQCLGSYPFWCMRSCPTDREGNLGERSEPHTPC
jgi:hypothetical protein